MRGTAGRWLRCEFLQYARYSREFAPCLRPAALHLTPRVGHEMRFR